MSKTTHEIPPKEKKELQKKINSLITSFEGMARDYKMFRKHLAKRTDFDPQDFTSSDSIYGSGVGEEVDDLTNSEFDELLERMGTFDDDDD